MADKSAVGKTGKPFKMHVDWSKVREFARAIKDPNPLYFDQELAKKEVGSLIARANSRTLLQSTCILNGLPVFPTALLSAMMNHPLST